MFGKFKELYKKTRKITLKQPIAILNAIFNPKSKYPAIKSLIVCPINAPYKAPYNPIPLK